LANHGLPREGEVSLGWPLGRPWKRERREVEVCGILEKVEIWKIGILENGNALACGGRK